MTNAERGAPPRTVDGPNDDDNSEMSSRQAGREAIIAAAAQAFMENGYTATSIDTVADILNCTKGRIYYYYKSKADLFFDLHQRAMTMNNATIEPLARGPGSPLERLRRMVIAHLMLVMNSLPLQRVCVQGVEMHLAGSTTPQQRRTLRAVIDMRDQFEKCFVDVIADGIACGELRPCEPRLAVKPFLGALNWTTVWYRQRPDETDAQRQALANQIADIVLTGLMAREMPPAAGSPAGRAL